MSTDQVAKYYDDYISDQLKSGINDRIYHLYRRLLGLGLKPTSNVLELGSGIGTMTFLLSKYVRKGQIEAVDISPGSIEFARQRIVRENIKLIADDIVTYQPAITDIDFITLFDILEHIPVEKHSDLFQNISRISLDNTKIAINIPSPASVEFDRKYNPASLQIIDQPLPLPFLLENIEKHGLDLIFFETYSIWVAHDYQFLLLEKKKEFKEVNLSASRNFFQKARKKIEREYVKLRYKYQ